MTPKQKETYDFIRRYWKSKGHGPSYSDIMEGVNLKGRGGVHRLVHTLHDLGWIKMTPGRARSVVPIDLHPDGRTRKTKPKTKAPTSASADPWGA